MTEEERDQLASTYLDGEATQQEVALVERDSDLQLRVQKLQSVSTQLGAPVSIAPGVKERHLAAALAQFDPSQSLSSDQAPTVADSQGDGQAGNVDPASPPSDRADNVVDLTSRRSESPPSLTETPMTPVRSRSMPQWLSAAVVSLFLLGGGFWLASQMGSSDDASVELADAPLDLDESTDAAAVASDGEAMEESEAMEDSAADSAEADEDFELPATTTTQAATENTAAASDSEALEDEAAPADDETAAADDGADDVETASAGGFFPNEPVASFVDTPDAAELVEAPPAPPRVDLEQSQCVNEIGRPVQVTGYLPIEVGGQPAEFFIFIDENDSESGIVLDADCQPLT